MSAFTWTPELARLAQNTEVGGYDVVADWLEENGCVQAAKCFRVAEQAPWRRVIAVMALMRPTLQPDMTLLTALSAFSKTRSKAFVAGALDSFIAEELFSEPLPDLPRVTDEPRPEWRGGKSHCGLSADGSGQCEVEPYGDERCDCGCSSRCGPWNDYLDVVEAWKRKHGVAS